MQNDNFVIIPKVKVHPQYISIYKEYVWSRPRARMPRDNSFIPEKNDHNGEISKRSASRIKKAIAWFLYIANEKNLPSSFHGATYRFKLSFITLTLSSKQIHSDHEIKSKLLNQFLVEARKKWALQHYLWRAEPQCNGNIHFHILCDKYIPWSELRDVWNRIQNKLGYVDAYRDQMRQFHSGGFQVRQDLLKKWSYKSQIRAYREGSRRDWNAPNSTDIHSVWKIKNLPAYLAKYCTKNEKGRKIEGNLWNLSESLSGIKGAEEIIDFAISDELNKICENRPEKVHRDQYFSVIYITIPELREIGAERLLKSFSDYLQLIKSSYT